MSKRLAALGWSRISMDSIVSAFEQCFPETGINSYQGLSSLETYHVISRKLGPFIKAMLQSAYSEAGGERAVIDVYQLLPEDYLKELASEGTCAVWLGNADCSPEERFMIQKQYDTERDYTFYKSDEELIEGAHYIVEQSQLIRSSCHELNLPYFDTTHERETVLNAVTEQILAEAGA